MRSPMTQETKAVREVTRARVGRWLLAALVCGIALEGPQAMAEVQVISDRASRTLLYEVRPTQEFVGHGGEPRLIVSEPISLPITNGPVMVMTSIVDPRRLFPDPAYGSASVTLTSHPRGIGFNPENGALSWAGLDAEGVPHAGLVRLPNAGDARTYAPIIGIVRDGEGELIAGPKPSQFRVTGPRDSVIRVRLIW